jgi:hypothetical protein
MSDQVIYKLDLTKEEKEKLESYAKLERIITISREIL